VEEEDMTIQGQITGVRTVGIPVTDQDRAIDFYVGTLGFEKRLDADLGGGRRWIEVAPAGTGTSVALVRAHEGLPAGVETGIRFVTPDAEAVHAGLRAAGVDAGDILRWPGVPPMFAFRDPDGNGMEITEQR
jgi:catechol 2,3-dioxygenase-like lactoylglutathione lyase family enzyme